MNKDDLVIATLPIKPQMKTNVGMLIGPTVSDFLGNVYQCKNVIGINTLNSYTDKDSLANQFINDLKSNYINYTNIVIDKDYANFILEKIENMVYNGLIKEKVKKRLVCECGKVDILEDTINSNAKLYHYTDNKVFCNSCNSFCKSYSEKVLCLNLDAEINDDINITPIFLKKEMIAFSKTFKGADLLVSKNRKTGYELMVNGKIYNIDIDFIWSNYFDFFSENSQVLIASNHQLLTMYIINYLSKLVSDKNIYFLATPYILSSENINFEYFFSKDIESYKKLFILYHLKWKLKDCYLSESIVKYLNSISNTKLNNLYKTMLMDTSEFENNTIDLSTQINMLLERRTNLQENIKIMKKLYKEGRL